MSLKESLVSKLSTADNNATVPASLNPNDTIFYYSGINYDMIWVIVLICFLAIIFVALAIAIGYYCKESLSSTKEKV